MRGKKNNIRSINEVLILLINYIEVPEKIIYLMKKNIILYVKKIY